MQFVLLESNVRVTLYKASEEKSCFIINVCFIMIKVLYDVLSYILFSLSLSLLSLAFPTLAVALGVVVPVVLIILIVFIVIVLLLYWNDR